MTFNPNMYGGVPRFLDRLEASAHKAIAETEALNRDGKEMIAMMSMTGDAVLWLVQQARDYWTEP